MQRTDQEIFKRLADASRGILVPSPFGLMPLDPLLQSVLDNATVRMLLAPLPGNVRVADAPLESNTGRTRKRKAASSGKAPPPPPNFPRLPSTGKGTKGSGKGVRGPRMPLQLVGGRAMTSANEPICFGYNLGSCQAGDACRRKHVCTKCEGPHPASACPKK